MGSEMCIRDRPTPFSVSVSAPRSSGGAARTMLGANQFPSLPTNQAVAQRQAEKRSLLGRSAAPAVPRSWGASSSSSSTAATNPEAFPSLSEMSGALPRTTPPAAEPVPAQGGGKQRRKKGVLLSSVSSMHHV